MTLSLILFRSRALRFATWAKIRPENVRLIDLF
jgi:hypothetical protein